MPSINGCNCGENCQCGLSCDCGDNLRDNNNGEGSCTCGSECSCSANECNCTK